MKTFPTTLLSLERIFSISHEIITNPSLDEILHSIVRVAADLAASEIAYILLSDSSSKILNFVAINERNDRLFEIPIPIDHSIAGAAFASNEPLIVNDPQHHPRYDPKLVDQPFNFTPHSVLAVPLTFREHKIGVLQVVNKKQGQFDEKDVDLLVVLAAQATITIEIANLCRQVQEETTKRSGAEEELRCYQKHLEELVEERTAEVQRLAITDSLTGLFNRHQLMILGKQAIQQAQRYRQPFSAMLIDIDCFRNFNDAYGHRLGDEILRKLADVLRNNVRTADISVRYGGEEFAVLMPNTNLEAAYELAERLLIKIRELRVETSQGQLGVTASIGVAEMNQTPAENLEALVNRVDQALYTAKHTGRNQVFVSSEEPFIARLYRLEQEEIAERIKIEDELRRHQDHLEALVQERTAEVHRLATSDSLTGLLSSPQLIFLGNQALQQAQGEHHHFSAMFIDLDHFKKINDTYGHALGDEALKQLADILRKNSRPADLIGRYDGEEFAVLMPRTDLEGAYEQAENLLNQIRALQINTGQGQFGFTASIGVVEMDQGRQQTLGSLIDLAEQAMGAAKQAGRNQVFIGNLLAEVQRQAFTDPLTGLFTRGYWTLLGTQMLQEALRYQTSFSAMMIDGDRFKGINDNFGHAMGDEAAKKMAETLKQNVRSTDIVGRYGGGDEFIVLMPHTPLQAACELAERLLHRIRELQIDTGDGQFLTVSIGVVEIDQNQPQTLDELVQLADRAQYTAKRAGGNQVSLGDKEHAAAG